jgi:hypothetical protein
LEAADVPLALVAVTVKVYEVPAENAEVIVIGEPPEPVPLEGLEEPV